MINILLISIGKLTALFSRTLNFGGGSTWPGHIVLELKPTILGEFAKNFHGTIILIAGTNGKTTTAKMLRTILEHQGIRVTHNEAGANLLNGIASAFIQNTSILGRALTELAIFEVDENTLPAAIEQLSPDVIVLLNLFRDQLDRYGEVDIIANKWNSALQNLSKSTGVILNADDPYIAYLGKNLQNVHHFGINDKKNYRKTPQHAMDAAYCPQCAAKLRFSGIYFSHLGVWRCPSCDLARPKIDPNDVTSPLPGLYNEYNVRAALLAAKTIGIDRKKAIKTLTCFAPAFGRQEEFEVNGKKVKIFLSKNPTGLNESLRTVSELGGNHLLLVLNDRIPDGRDVSWIWDVDFEELESKKNITVSGDRAFDLGLRLKYTSSSKIQSSKFKVQNHSVKFKIFEDLAQAISSALNQIRDNDTLFILPTYSAMLEVRKILTGKKML